MPQQDVDEWLLAINGPLAREELEAVEREIKEEQAYKNQPVPQNYQRQNDQYRPQGREQQYKPESREEGYQTQPIDRVSKYPAQPQVPQVQSFKPPVQKFAPQQPVQEYSPPGRVPPPALQRSPQEPYPERPQFQQRNQQRYQQRKKYPGQANRPYPGPANRPRRPLRPRRPPPSNGGILNNIVKGAVDTVGNAVDAVSCGTKKLFAEASLEDEAFITKQFECIRGAGCCDEIGKKIKFLAPEVLQGRCPGCELCEEQQINRVMSIVSNKYTAEWNLLMQEFRKPGGGSLRNSPIKPCQ